MKCIRVCSSLSVVLLRASFSLPFIIVSAIVELPVNDVRAPSLWIFLNSVQEAFFSDLLTLAGEIWSNLEARG